jgi:hypothetical protein
MAPTKLEPASQVMGSNRGSVLILGGVPGSAPGGPTVTTVLPGHLDLNHRPLGYEYHH